MNFRVLGFPSTTKVWITSEMYHNQFKKNQCAFLNQDLQKGSNFVLAFTAFVSFPSNAF